MNIMQALRVLAPGKKLLSDAGYTARLDPDDGMIVNESGEPFGFWPEELLSEKWTVIDE